MVFTIQLFQLFHMFEIFHNKIVGHIRVTNIQNGHSYLSYYFIKPKFDQNTGCAKGSRRRRQGWRESAATLGGAFNILKTTWFSKQHSTRVKN